MTIAFEKPFLLSHALKPYIADADFRSAIADVGFTAESFIFSLTTHSFRRQLRSAFKDRKNLSKLAAILKISRTWDQVAIRFAQAIPTYDYAGRRTFAIMGDGVPISYAHT